MVRQPSEIQMKFLWDLTRDMMRLFYARDPRKSDRDFIAWLGGFMNKNIVTEDLRYYRDLEDVWAVLCEVSEFRVRRLIGALSEARGRMDSKLDREKIITPPPLLRAIWTAARRNAIDEETVQEIVHNVTAGETTSTKHLRRAEAIEALRRAGGETRVFEMTPPPSSRPGARPGFREAHKTVV